MSEEAAKAMLRRVANIGAHAVGTTHDLALAEQAWAAGIAEYLRVAGLEGDPAALLLAEREKTKGLRAAVTERDAALATAREEVTQLRAAAALATEVSKLAQS